MLEIAFKGHEVNISVTIWIIKTKKDKIFLHSLGFNMQGYYYHGNLEYMIAEFPDSKYATYPFEDIPEKPGPSSL